MSDRLRHRIDEPGRHDDRDDRGVRGVVLIPGGPAVNALIVLGMLVLIVFMARNFWRVAKEPERRPGEPPDHPDDAS